FRSMPCSPRSSDCWSTEQTPPSFRHSSLARVRHGVIIMAGNEWALRQHMAILVTGGAGYIGSHLVHGLVDAGEQAVVIDDLSAGFQKSLPPDTPLIVGNCGNPELVSTVIRQHEISVVIHLAASVSVFGSIAKPQLY